MTFRTLAFATALTSVSALAAHAASDAIEDEGTVRPLPDEAADTMQSGSDANPEQHADDKDLDPVDEDLPEADLTEADPVLPEIDPVMDLEAEAPSQTDLMTKELTNAERTLVENVLAEADRGATLSTVDDYVVGEVTGTHGEEGADHLIYVEVHEDTDLAAEILAFRASSLSVERAGDLEYAMSMETLRKNVAERVAAQSQ